VARSSLQRRSLAVVPSFHLLTHTHTHTHQSDGPLSGTTRASRYQKGKRSSAIIAEGPRDASRRQLKSCQLPRNSAGTTCTTSPEQILNKSKAVSQLINHTDPKTENTHTRLTVLSGNTRVSRYQKGKTSLDFTGARDSEWQWHQLGRMQICTSLQTDNHASTPSLSFYRPDALLAAQPTASKH